MANIKTRIEYYTYHPAKNPFDDFLNSLSHSQQSKVLRVLVHLELYGLQQIIPHIKKLVGTPFWEIRILGKDNIRVIFVSPVRNYILILHGFIKKSQKTLKKDIDIVYSRYYEWSRKNS